MTEFSQRHRDILADRLISIVAPGRRGGVAFANLVREGNETVVLRAALLAMQDVEQAVRLDLGVAANGKDAAVLPPQAAKELAPNVWHDTVPMAEGSPLPAGLRPNDMVMVVFRDGFEPDISYPANIMAWDDRGAATITKFKIVAAPLQAPGADDWRAIPINAGTLHDLLLSHRKLHPGGNSVLDAAGLDIMAMALKTVAEIRARAPQ